MTETPEQHGETEGQPPDVDRIGERADYPDPAFDDVHAGIEDPIDDEGDAPDLPPEDPALLEADEQIDPEEPDIVLPPQADEPPETEGDDRDVAGDGPAH